MELRDYQSRIVDKTIDFIANDIPSVCITSPTGSGKSIMGLAIADYFTQRGMSVGWVAMRRNLLRQAAEMNRAWNKTDIHFISMFDNNPLQTDVIIADECVTADTEVTVFKDGKQCLATIDDIMNNMSITHVLSVNEAGELEYKEITSRDDMGIKEIYEVVIEDENGVEHTLNITGNGKIYSEGDYIRVDELKIGAKTKCI